MEKTRVLFKARIERKCDEEQAKTETYMEACSLLKTELFALQRERLSILRERTKPIVVYGLPCAKTNYKLRLKYLQGSLVKIISA